MASSTTLSEYNTRIHTCILHRAGDVSLGALQTPDQNEYTPRKGIKIRHRLFSNDKFKKFIDLLISW